MSRVSHDTLDNYFIVRNLWIMLITTRYKPFKKN